MAVRHVAARRVAAVSVERCRRRRRCSQSVRISPRARSGPADCASRRGWRRRSASSRGRERRVARSPTSRRRRRRRRKGRGQSSRRRPQRVCSTRRALQRRSRCVTTISTSRPTDRRVAARIKLTSVGQPLEMDVEPPRTPLRRPRSLASPSGRRTSHRRADRLPAAGRLLRNDRARRTVSAAARLQQLASVDRRFANASQFRGGLRGRETPSRQLVGRVDVPKLAHVRETPRRSPRDDEHNRRTHRLAWRPDSRGRHRRSSSRSSDPGQRVCRRRAVGSNWRRTRRPCS